MSAPREQFEAKWLESHQLLEIYPEFKYVSWLEEQYDALQAERDDARKETKHWYEATLTAKRWREELEAERDTLRAALEEAVEMADMYYGYFESEFRITSDPPDTEWEVFKAKMQQLLAEPAAPQPEGKS